MNLEGKMTTKKLNEQKLELGKALPYQVLSNHLEPVAKLGEKLFNLGQGSIDYQFNKDKFTYHCFQNYYPHWQQYESFYKGGAGSPKLQERYLLKTDLPLFTIVLTTQDYFRFSKNTSEYQMKSVWHLKLDLLVGKE